MVLLIPFLGGISMSEILKLKFSKIFAIRCHCCAIMDVSRTQSFILQVLDLYSQPTTEARLAPPSPPPHIGHRPPSAPHTPTPPQVRFLWSDAILILLHSVRVLHLQNLQHRSQLPHQPPLNQRHQVVFLQQQQDQQPPMLQVVTLQLAILLLRRATPLEQASMDMLSQPTMDLLSRQHTAKLYKGTGFLLEALKVQRQPPMAILKHQVVEVLLLH